MNAATSANQNPDNTLSRLKSGDDCAFNELVQSNWEKIYNRANGLLGNRQDAFLRARKSLCNFRGDCSISTWLYHIATNLARNKHWYWWRRKRSQSVSLESPIAENEDVRFCDIIPGEDDTPAEEAESSEFITGIPAAMAALPPKYSEVIRLRVAEDLSYEEISERLDISVGTVKSRLSRAREFLRIELEKRS